MRTHQQIIVDANGPAAVGRLVGAAGGTVKQWRRTDSIPAPYWQAFADHKIATLQELASAAARRLTPPANDTQSQSEAA